VAQTLLVNAVAWTLPAQAEVSSMPAPEPLSRQSVDHLDEAGAYVIPKVPQGRIVGGEWAGDRPGGRRRRRG
jgi:hypothetical protein